MKKRLFGTCRTVFDGVRIPWVWLLISLVSSFLLANALIKSAVITAAIIDKSGNIKTQMLVEYVVFSLGGSLLAIVSNYAGSVMTEKLNIGVREKLWNKLLRLPLRFYDQESGETLVSRITTDCSKASGYFNALTMLVTSIYALILAAVNMYQFSPYLTTCVLILLPVLAVLVSLCGRLVVRLADRLYQERSNMVTYLLERVRNFRLVRTSNMMEAESRTGGGLFRALFGASIRFSLGDTLMSSFISLSTIGVIVITFIMGSGQIASGKLSTGTVVAFYGIATMASIRFNVLITVYGTIMENNGVFRKICQVLETPEEPESGVPVDVPDADIRFEHVDFAYGQEPVLKDLSCVIPRRKITAVIGANGAGKSTLFKLLCRMYAPNRGEILFGGASAETFSLASWRKAFAMVAQDRPLLSGTIRENITYGCDRTITNEELELVAEQAGILELVRSLPDGFETEVGPNGGNFSGGQRQCIAIARAIMRNPDYLLLDEATSDLDNQSEQMVSAALENLMRGRTTIIIGHSLQAIRTAHNLIVLKDGQVEAEGAPEDVYQISETYRSFVDSQVNDTVPCSCPAAN